MRRWLSNRSVCRWDYFKSTTAQPKTPCFAIQPASVCPPYGSESVCLGGDSHRLSPLGALLCARHLSSRAITPLLALFDVSDTFSRLLPNAPCRSPQGAHALPWHCWPCLPSSPPSRAVPGRVLSCGSLRSPSPPQADILISPQSLTRPDDHC